jgi:hypothetical protein
MYNVWDRDTSHRPTDMDRIGKIFLEVFQFTWTPELLSFRKYTPISTRMCTMEDAAKFPKEIYQYVSEDFIYDYYCINEEEKFEIWNNNAYDSANLVIKIEPCTGTNCYDQATLEKRLSKLFVDVAWTK